MSIIDTLVFDRNENDLKEYTLLRLIPYEEMTQEQKAKWDNGLKGAYNYTDINRVNQAVEYLATNLSNQGYNVIINSMDILDITSIKDKQYFETYLSNVSELMNKFYVKEDTPDLPEDVEDIKTIDGANNIEKILFDIDDLSRKLSSVYRYCDTFNCGDGLEELD